jgi:glycerol-3-phosphate dehydrogenase (NAD+)
MVGSGAWACAAMHIVAQNCAAFDEADEFVDDVRMWVFEEDYEVRATLETLGPLGLMMRH